MRTCEATASSSAHPPSSHSSGSEGVPTIFLSHSGKQKPFVENLFNALRRVNHTPFFDQHTLPKGFPFPDRIKKAAEGCELGVVVLSEDFFTSKWPMIELEILFLQRGPERALIPLFYKLGPDDLKSRENLCRWRQAWEKMAGNHPPDVEKWVAAVKALNGLNGEIFTQGMSEKSYIDRVVRNLCKVVPSPLREDLSFIEGRDRMANEVAGHFDHAYDSRQSEEACFVGLHGVGGLGKTTMCKIMVSFYSVEYARRGCHHLEFPTDDKDCKELVQECKKALKELVNLSDELLNRAYNFDQVIQLMKEHLSQLDVFLAIDNVWESSLEAAKRILRVVGFSAKSKILLTSRSEEVLSNLLRAHNNSCVRLLPALQHEEAFQIFQAAFGECDSDIKVLESCSDQVDRIMKKCMFAGNYHALALKGLGWHASKGCTPGDTEGNEEFLSHLSQQFRIDNLETLQIAIRLSYNYLPELKKRMFLDIAIWRMIVWRAEPSYHYTLLGKFTVANCHYFLSALYNESETLIRTLIQDLALGGLVRLEADGMRGCAQGNERIVTVHDLYSDLAHTEAETSSRFFIISERTSKPVEEIEWEKLERVILCPDGWREESGMNTTRFIEKLQQHGCQKLQVLHASGIGLFRGLKFCMSWIDLRRMPFLRVLYLEKCHGLKRIEGLDSMKSLRELSVLNCKLLENLDGLSALAEAGAEPQLKALLVVGCERLKELPDLSRLTCLEMLVLSENSEMERVAGFSPLALKIIRISGCTSLKRIPDLSGCTLLEELDLQYNAKLEEVRGVLSSNLRNLSINGRYTAATVQLTVWCGGLMKEILDLSRFTRLDSLRLHYLSMEQLGGLSSTIQKFSLVYCDALKRVPDLSGLTCLGELELSDIKALRRMPDLSGLTRLEILKLSSNGSLEEVGCLSSTLKHVHVQNCTALRKMPDISGLTRLESLTLNGNESLEELGGQYASSSLRNLSVFKCERLRSIPSLKECVHLGELTTSVIDLFLPAPPPNLHMLIVKYSDAVRLDVGCLRPLTNLKDLTVRACPNLEEIANTGELEGLERLGLQWCPCLKKVDGVDVDINVEKGRLSLQRCSPSQKGIYWTEANLLEFDILGPDYDDLGPDY